MNSIYSTVGGRLGVAACWFFGLPFVRERSDVKISKGIRVRLKVKLQVEGGDVLEESIVEYVQGGGTMLAGLESELEGLEKGAKKSGLIKAENAFGSPEHQHKKTISRTEFPEDAKLETGEQFAAKGPNGQDVILRIESADDKEVNVLYIHPLADKDIRFDVEILLVSDPAPPPLPAEAIASSDSES
jgi:FKBP-type peptidyl-prolyl cis-trans isomerase 2